MLRGLPRMIERKVWEEDLWTSNAPLPSRPWEGRAQTLPRLYVVEGEPLWPWTLHSLAPLDLERSWLPLPADHESAWLFRNGKVRHGLVDLSTGVIVDWRREGLASRWQPPEPVARDDEPPADPISRPRRTRTGRRRPTATDSPPSRKPTT